MSNEIHRNVGNITASNITVTSGGINLISGSSLKQVSKTYVIAPQAATIGSANLTLIGWNFNIDANIDFGVRGTVTGNWFYQNIREPINGATLDSIDLYYRLNGGARSPATRLAMGIRRQNINAFTGANLMATTQVPVYSTMNSLITTNFVTTGNQTIDTSQYTYMIWVQEESGAGALAGNDVYSFTINYTVSTSPVG